jgi:hypothetical protein
MSSPFLLASVRALTACAALVGACCLLAAAPAFDGSGPSAPAARTLPAPVRVASGQAALSGAPLKRPPSSGGVRQAGAGAPPRRRLAKGPGLYTDVAAPCAGQCASSRDGMPLLQSSGRDSGDGASSGRGTTAATTDIRASGAGGNANDAGDGLTGVSAVRQMPAQSPAGFDMPRRN